MVWVLFWIRLFLLRMELIAKGLKRLITRFRPISISFHSVTDWETQIAKVKSCLDFLPESIAKKQQMKFPRLLDQDNTATRKIMYNADSFNWVWQLITVIKNQYWFGDGECISTQTLTTQGIYCCIETQFAYHELDKMLLRFGSFA